MNSSKASLSMKDKIKNASKKDVAKKHRNKRKKRMEKILKAEELSIHFSNQSRSSLRHYEGGFGSSKPASVVNQNQREPTYVEDTEMDDEERALKQLEDNDHEISVGEGDDKAMRLIQHAIIHKEKRLFLENLQLQTLYFLQYTDWNTLTEVSVANNKILNIDILNKFESLKIINASNNHIEECNLHLRKLEILNLSYNELSTFPVLENMSKLRDLNLSYNRIENMINVNIKFTINLKVLDMSFNKLQFKRQMDFDNFITMMCKLSILKVLNINNNPYSDQPPQDADDGLNMDYEILKMLKKLDIYNREDSAQYFEALQRQVKLETQQRQAGAAADKAELFMEEKQKFDQALDDSDEQDEGVKRQQQNKARVGLPTLTILLYRLEAANSHPSEANEHLKELNDSVTAILKNLDTLEHYFVSGLTDETQIRDDIEAFMQNAVLLIDNYQEHQQITLSILAKLSKIRFYEFGLSCFNTLKELMKSGREMEEIVEEVIQDEVIAQFEGEDVQNISVSLLQGLYGLVSDTLNANLLSGMLQSCFPRWLKAYNKLLKKAKKEGRYQDDDEHFDAIIDLLSVSVICAENVDIIVDSNLIPIITEMFKTTQISHKRYIPILNLITGLADASTENADNFIDDGAHTILAKTISRSMNMYKKFRSLNDENSTETDQQKMHKYKILAAEIKTLGGLLFAERNRDKILETHRDILLDIINIMSHDQTDPILLEAVCKIAKDLLECDEIRDSKSELEPYHDRMKSLQYLIPYLGGGMYQQLLEMTRRYHKAENPEPKITNSGHMEDTQLTHKQQEVNDDTLDDEGDNNAQQAMIESSLEHLDDPLAFALFQSIISLMEVVCLQAEKNQKNSLFQDMSTNLNKNGREDALFLCLKVPDDGVKLAVVRCLLVVPLGDLDPPEIENITRIMSTCKNISAGETELVLSVVYWICTKFVTQPEEGKEFSKSQQVFQRSFGDQTIKDGLNILDDNLKRVLTTENDDFQKYALSLSILNFLKTASKIREMQKFMKNQNRIFRSILINEDKKSTQVIKEIPIDIENTYIGKEINTLLDCISGIETISPYSDVSFRILARIADVLQGRDALQSYEIEEEKDTNDELRTFQIRLYRKRIKLENEFWYDIPNGYHESLNSMEQQHVEEQHKQFSQSNAVANIMQFLFTKFPENEDYVKALSDPQMSQNLAKGQKPLAEDIFEKKEFFEEKFQMKYDPPESNDIYSVRRAFYKKELKKGNISKVKKEEVVAEDRDGDGVDDNEEDDEQNAQMNSYCKDCNIYKTEQHMQYEELGLTYLDTLIQAEGEFNRDEIEKKLIEKRNLDNKKKEQEAGGFLTMKDRRGDGFLNPHLRSLNIAAFLRCLYAAIEFAPSQETRNNAILSIRDSTMFRAITQLCDSTNWDEKANIGSKYLRVMRSIIKLPLDQHSESSDMIMHYNLVSIVIQKTLSKIVDKMKKDIQQTSGDKIAIYEISYTLATILQQCNNFEFSKFDVVKLFNQKNVLIRAQMSQGLKGAMDEEQIQELQEKSEGLFSDPDDQTRKKCLFTAPVYEDEIGEETFQPDVVQLRRKRTIQQKVVEYMVLKLFTNQTIYSLVDILFNDMYDDSKIYQEAYQMAVDEAASDVEEEVQDQDKSPAQEGDGADETGGGGGPGAEETGQGQDSEGDEEEENENEDEAEEQNGEVNRINYGWELEPYTSLKGTLSIERIKDIIGLIMSSCKKKMEYAIMEYIMKGVIFDKKSLRESFMQEVLYSSKLSSFVTSLERYLNTNKITVENYFRQLNNEPLKDNEIRVIELCDVEMNIKCIEWVGPGPAFSPLNEESIVDHNFVKRIFVVCSQGIQILKDIPKAQQCRNTDCPLQAFCPRGPQQVFCIRFIQIKSIIKCPQIPQKIIILYQDELDCGFGRTAALTNQMTIHLKSYTATSKLYLTLMSILKHTELERSKIEAQAKKEQQKLLESLKQEGGGEGPKEGEQPQQQQAYMASNPFYGLTNFLPYQIDVQVQFELRMLIQQFTKDDEKVEKEQINEIEMMYATLQDTNLLKNDFKQRKLHSKIKNQSRYLPYRQAADVAGEDEVLIDKKVLVCIIGNQFLLLREKWKHWNIEEATNVEKMQEVKVSIYTAKKDNDGELPLSDKWKANPLQEPDKEDRPAFMEYNCQYLSRMQLLKAVLQMKMEDIHKLEVHKGRKPTVEIHCYDETPYEEREKNPDLPPYQYSIQLCFTGDMERQKFIDMVWEYHCEQEGGGADEEEKEGILGAVEEEDESSEEEDLQESEEEIGKPTIYD